MTLEEAAAYKTVRETKEACTQAITDFFAGLPPEQPDLVVMFRGKRVVLNTVAPSKDATVLKLLHDLTLSDVFKGDAAPEANKKRSSGKRARSVTVDVE
jgi:hypothetical protein